MIWALATVGLIVLCVGLLVLTIGQIQHASAEGEYFRLSIRFWAALAMLGALLFAAFAHPMLSWTSLPAPAAWLTMGLVSLPIGVVIGGGLRNAFALARARRRRRTALREGQEFEATVIERAHSILGQDLFSVTVETDLPVETPELGLAYRTRDLRRTQRCRFVETCPGDQWDRFEPGRNVKLRVDPEDQAHYAVVLFGA